MSKKVKKNIMYLCMMVVSAITVRIVASSQEDTVQFASIQKYDTMNYQKVSYEKNS